MKLILTSLEDTGRLGQVIANHVRPRDMIILSGQMGAGKTTFTQFFARSLGIIEKVTSPTFNLLHNYASGKHCLHHADLYRLERTGELADLGLDELQDRGGIVIVEWGEIVGDALGDSLSITLNHSIDLDATESRDVDIHPNGQQWASRWQALQDQLASGFTKSKSA